MSTEEKLAIALGALQSIAMQGYEIPREIALRALERISPLLRGK